MSTHLTLSEGRENLRLRKLSTGLDVFPPTSRWRKKKWLLHDLPCHVSELFHFCCCLFLIFVFVNSIGERKRFQTESLAWAIRRRDFWFCAGCFIWYWLLFYICVLNKPIFNECFTTSVRVLETWRLSLLILLFLNTRLRVLTRRVHTGCYYALSLDPLCDTLVLAIPAWFALCI